MSTDPLYARAKVTSGEISAWRDAAGARGGRRSRLMAEVRPAVSRYCRALLGRDERAAVVARAVCRTITATAPGTDDEAALTAFVYQTAAAAVEGKRRVLRLVGLPPISPSCRPASVRCWCCGLRWVCRAKRAAAALGATPDTGAPGAAPGARRLRAARPSAGAPPPVQEVGHRGAETLPGRVGPLPGAMDVQVVGRQCGQPHPASARNQATSDTGAP